MSALAIYKLVSVGFIFLCLWLARQARITSEQVRAEIERLNREDSKD